MPRHGTVETGVDGYDGDTSGGTATAITNYVWTSWVDTTSSATTVSGLYIWPTWVQTSNAAVSLAAYSVSDIVDTRTPEQIAADEARDLARLAEELRQHEAVKARYLAVTERARTLLEALLTHQQREQLRRDQYFDVIAGASRRRYRIRHGTHGNVRLLDEQGREVTSYCGQPNGVPIEDAMLAQKLQIEHDEPGFLRAANATAMRRAM